MPLRLGNPCFYGRARCPDATGGLADSGVEPGALPLPRERKYPGRGTLRPWGVFHPCDKLLRERVPLRAGAFLQAVPSNSPASWGKFLHRQTYLHRYLDLGGTAHRAFLFVLSPFRVPPWLSVLRKLPSTMIKSTRRARFFILSDYNLSLYTSCLGPRSFLREQSPSRWGPENKKPAPRFTLWKVCTGSIIASPGVPDCPASPAYPVSGIGSARFASTERRVVKPICLGHQVCVPECSCCRDCRCCPQ